MPRVLVVVASAGGSVPPMLGIGRALAGLGHEVEVLSHADVERRAAVAGLAFRPFHRARSWSPVHEESGVLSLLAFLPLATDPGIAGDVRAAVAAHRPDVVVVDCMLPSALAAARALGVPTAMVMHTVQGYWRDQWSRTSPMGVWLRARRLHPRRLAPDLTLVATLPEFDPGPAAVPGSLQVGPVLGRLGEPSSRDADLPVLVSFSTISYPGQQAVIQRVLDALAGLGVPGLVTNPTGLRGLRVPSGTQVRSYLPHEEVLPRVRAVVCHGGHGTTMMALAHGLPVAVVPLTSHADHVLMGRLVERAGVGVMVPKGADPATTATSLERLLAMDTAYVEQFRDLLRSTDGAASAARAVANLQASGPPPR